MNKNIYNAAKINILILAVFFNFFPNCVLEKNKPDFRTIQFVSSVPIISDNGKVIELQDTIMGFFSNAYTIFKVPTKKSLSNIIVNKNGEIVDQIFKGLKKGYYYFIHKNSSLYGYKLDSLDQTNGKRYLADSFLSGRWIIPPGIFFDLHNDSLINQTKTNGFLIERYVPKNKDDATYPDSSTFYYTSSMKGLGFSYSKELDSLKKMKLCKVELIYNENPKGNNLFERLAKRIFIQFNEISAAKDEEIINFINRLNKNEN